VLLVSGKANSGGWRQPVTCRKKRYRWSRLNSLLGNVFTAARVWSSTTRHMIATRLPFNYPRTSYSRWGLDPQAWAPARRSAPPIS
jgi:hypothetical protein